MPFKKNNSLHKIFVTKVYSSLSQIEVVVNTIALKSNVMLQVSILGQCSSLSVKTKTVLEKILTTTKQGLSTVVGSSVQFGYFNHPEYGQLYIAGHLTPTFLTKVDNRELASLPAGLIGIFRQLGLNEKETKTYLTTVKDKKSCLIIRMKQSDLETMNSLLGVN